MSVSFDAFSNSGYISFNVILISSTALLAELSLSKPVFNLSTYILRSVLFSPRIVLKRFNNSKKDVGVT
jgi:hypothetical protein